MLEGLKVRKHKRLLKRLNEAVMNDRTESARRQILAIQMRGFSPEFLNYVP
ncbi:MAG: hypothetical protein IJ667_10085 [Synergistaceae bacterium]|nr:hypothetical protein [Synergistaceae bacterium]